MVGTKSDGRHAATAAAGHQWPCDFACTPDINLSVQAIPIAETMNTQWMMVCHITPVAVSLVQGMPVDKVHVLMNGRIVEEGGPELIDEINHRGFTHILDAQGAK